MECKGKAVYISFVISIFVSFAFIYYIYTDPVQTSFAIWILDSNVKIYSFFLIIFFGSFFIVNMLGRIVGNSVGGGKREDARLLPKTTQILLTTAVAAVGFAIFAHWAFITQFEEFGVCNGTYYAFPMAFRLILMLLIFFWMAWMIIRDKDIEDVSVWAMYAISIIVTFMGLFIANPFSFVNAVSEFSMRIYDNTSVTETIYNVFDGVPYLYSTTGLYGHYALFFLLPLKIIGAGSAQVVGLIALCGCLEQLATIYVIHTFAPKKWIKVLLASAAVIRTTYTYPAISPIRTLFPMILCAFITFLYIHNKQVWLTKWFCIGYTICSAAVLWNTETGIGCIIGFTAYILVEVWQQEVAIWWKRWLTYFVCLAFSIGSILLAIVVVNIYNIFCGASDFVFSSFFYPYISSSWTTEYLRCNVPLGNHAWIYIMLLLLGCASWGWYHTRIFHADKCQFMKEAKLIAGMSFTGIIIFAYYFNEAHWGCMEIIHPIATCLVALILYKFWHVMSSGDDNARFEDQLYRGIVILALLIFSLLAIEVLGDPIRISARYKAEAYNIELLREESEKLIAEIPAETYGVGQGINIIYHEIGWNNHANYRDTTAIDIADSNGSMEKLVEEIIMQDSFLISNIVWDDEVDDEVILDAVLSADDSYRLKKTVTVMGCEYMYYVKE